MKRILTGLAAGGLMLAGAGAALGDGPAYKSVKDVPHHEHFTWSGFYGGLSVGGMSSKIKGNFQNAPGFFWDSGKQSDAVAGLHGGYQHQFGSFVLGLEGGYKSVLSHKFSSKIAGGAGAPCGFVAAVQSCEGRVDSILQIGGRVGYAVQTVLLYGTGGYALGSLDTQGLTNANGQPFSGGGAEHRGGFYGAGLEYAATKNLILGVEYTHYNLDSNVHFTPSSIDSRTVSAKSDAVTARISFKTN